MDPWKHNQDITCDRNIPTHGVTFKYKISTTVDDWVHSFPKYNPENQTTTQPLLIYNQSVRICNSTSARLVDYVMITSFFIFALNIL